MAGQGPGPVDSMLVEVEKMLKMVAVAQTFQDADLPWLLQLQQMLTTKLREPVTQMQQQGIMPADPNQVPAGGAQMGAPMSPLGMGNPSAPGPMPPGAGPGPIPMQPGGLHSAPQISPDELRRLLTHHR